MCRKLICLISFVLVLTLAGTNAAFGDLTVEVRVAASNDDAEEKVVGGGMSRGSSDLELGYEDSFAPENLQIVGIRFTGVGIPKGSTIQKAWVRFTVDDKDEDDHAAPVSVIVGGELSPDPVDFSSGNPNISSRATTTASVVWDIPVWGRNQGTGPAESTPDISRVIQEIIDQDGWAAGNAMVIILKDNPANPSAGTREAEAFGTGGDAPLVPLLHIEYTIRAATDPDPADGGISGRAPLLQWTKGATAAFHDVYLGTDELAVEGADASDTTGIYQGRQFFTAYWHIPGLTPGTTYYWRIDGVEADGTTIYTGDLWSFTAVGFVAHSPTPPNGDKMVLPDAVLSWGSGVSAATHDVYFSTSRADVAAGTGGTFKGNQSGEAYNTGVLQNGTTYYWRIDEVEADGVTRHAGDLWSFKTRNDPALIGWWKFDEGQGIIAYDSSGYGHHGIIGHDNGDAGPGWADGIMDGGLFLDGDDDYVSINSIVPMMTTYSFTFSMWIKTDDDSAGEHQLLASNTDSSHEFLFGLVNGNPWQETSAVDEVGYPPSVADNQWHMITYVGDLPNCRIYVDGVLRKEDLGDDDSPEDTRWSIGQEWGSGPGDEFLGIVDDARLWIRPLSAEEVAELFKGDVDLAHSPKPANLSTTDVEKALPLSWSPGEKAAQHDVYFGTDGLAVEAADASDTTGVYRGRQAATSYTPPEGVEANQVYYWRIDEYNTDATISRGRTWSFTVADYLIVDDFDDYTDYEPDRIFDAWDDGWQTPANGSQVGYDEAPFAEQSIVHSGSQSMPFSYNNTAGVTYSEAEQTFAIAQDWTRREATSLTLWFRGESGNAADQLYVALADSTNNSATIQHPDAAATTTSTWTEWNIGLTDFTGVNARAIKKISIGVGNKVTPQAGGSGKLYIDDIRLYRP